MQRLLSIGERPAATLDINPSLRPDNDIECGVTEEGPPVSLT